MQKEIVLTADGSRTVVIPGKNISYHSRYGAVQESLHIFIGAGLTPLLQQTTRLHIFEMGFGSGLNALLTLREAIRNHKEIDYLAAETDPLTPEEYLPLEYPSFLKEPALGADFVKMHSSGFEQDIFLSAGFLFRKTRMPVTEFPVQERFHLIYYDAFAPGDQPELWTTPVFCKLFSLLVSKGILVTYCCKGTVRRSLEAAGFRIEKLPGPPGKKEFIRAWKD